VGAPEPPLVELPQTAIEPAFAALKSDGSIAVWGNSTAGGSGAPADNDYTKIYSTTSAFAALKSDGSITVWGHLAFGGSGAPVGAPEPPLVESPQAVIEPSGSRVAKAPSFE
jgi:hypothetical protein